MHFNEVNDARCDNTLQATELTQQLAEAKKRREERERLTLEAREAQAATTDGGEGSGD